MKREKNLLRVKVEDYSITSPSGIKTNLNLNVYGLFDTISLIWEYYVLSTITENGNVIVTPDVSKSPKIATAYREQLETIGIKFPDLESAKKFVNDFKSKWESGCNITLEESRDKKITQITNG